jgi:hypothetical protein
VDDAAKRNQLVRARDDSRATIYRGVTLLALVPVVVIAAAISAAVIGPVGIFALILAAAYGLVGGIGGVATIVAGVSGHRKARRELRAFDAPRQLPVARLLER